MTNSLRVPPAAGPCSTRVCGAESLSGVSVHLDDDRWRAAGAAGRMNAGFDCACSDDFCEAVRIRSAFAFRVARSIRLEGAAAAGARKARARRRDGQPDSRVLLCFAPLARSAAR